MATTTRRCTPRSRRRLVADASGAAADLRGNSWKASVPMRSVTPSRSRSATAGVPREPTGRPAGSARAAPGLRDRRRPARRARRGRSRAPSRPCPRGPGTRVRSPRPGRACRRRPRPAPARPARCRCHRSRRTRAPRDDTARGGLAGLLGLQGVPDDLAGRAVAAAIFVWTTRRSRPCRASARWPPCRARTGSGSFGGGSPGPNGWIVASPSSRFSIEGQRTARTSRPVDREAISPAESPHSRDAEPVIAGGQRQRRARLSSTGSPIGRRPTRRAPGGSAAAASLVSTTRPVCHQ